MLFIVAKCVPYLTRHFTSASIHDKLSTLSFMIYLDVINGRVGEDVGDEVVGNVGDFDGLFVGDFDGLFVGDFDGLFVGDFDGFFVGALVGISHT